MITENNLRQVLQHLHFEDNGDNTFVKKFPATDVFLKVDFSKKELIYPELLGMIVNERQTCNFSANENFVVFECVHRLLEKGYQPKHIELEPKWKVGRGASGGRADIVVKNQEDKPLLLIECKTAGKEFEKAWKETQQDGGQLFSYVQQIQETQFLCLYTSDFSNEKIHFEHYIITHKDIQNEVEKDADKEFKRLFYKDATNVEQRFQVWKETYHYDFQTKGIFETDIQAYNIGKEKITIRDLRYITANELKGKFNEFAKILREHNVSSKESAFDKLISLFLCKIVDETESQHNNKALDFYWRGEYADDYFRLIDRLQRLYKEGMQEYLGETITYIDNQKVIDGFGFYRDQNATRNYILSLFKQQKYFTNSDFGFIEVHNQKLFYQNAKILLDVVKMWQDFQLNGEQQNQFLSDMFEVFLDKGFKQSEGQFFTPIPICKFILSALPVEEIIKTYEKPPKVLDYACGSGHFLTEYATQARNIIQQLNQEIEQKEYEENEGKPLPTDVKKYYQSIFGVEKEYRLSKVAKISAFMYGQDEINIIYCDALNPIQQEIKQKIVLVQDEMIDILVANPPFAVEGFLKNISKEQKETYSLYKSQDINESTNNIQCFFLERAKQLLVKGGIAAIIVPTSILSNSDQMHIQTREILLKYFDFVSIVELGSGTFGKTGTNTVILFLKRKAQNPEQAEHFWNRTQDFFEDAENEIISNGGVYQDLPIVKKYCEHIEVPFEDYKLLLLNSSQKLSDTSKVSDNSLWKYDIFKEYKSTFEKNTEVVNLQKKTDFKKLSPEKQQEKLDKMLFEFMRKIEQEKLFYFMLAYHNSQKILIVKSPTDNKEQKQFLGYEWTNSKGQEGIKYNNGETVFDIQTPLFNPKDRNDPSKISYWIAQNFLINDCNPDFSLGETPRLKGSYLSDTSKVSDISENLIGLVTYANLTDLLDFSRKDFNKALSLTPKKTIQIDTKWELVKIEDLCEIGRGRVINHQYIEENQGDYPVYSSQTQNEGIMGYINTFDFEGEYVTWTTDGIYAGTCFYRKGKFNCTNVCGTLKIKNEKVLTKFLPLVLNDITPNHVVKSANPKLMNNVMANIKIPLPPLPIQEKIVSECEAIDQATEKAKNEVEKAKREIEGKVKELFGKGNPNKMIDLVHINLHTYDPTQYPEKEFIYVDIDSVEKGTGKIDFSQKLLGKNAPSRARRLAFKNNIVISTVRPYLKGFSFIEKEVENCIFSTGFAILESKDEKVLQNKALFFAFMYLEDLMKQMEATMGKVAYPSINKSDIENYKIPVPPLEMQEKLVSEIEILEKQITENELIIKSSAAQKQAVLKKYL